MVSVYDAAMTPAPDSQSANRAEKRLRLFQVSHPREAQLLVPLARAWHAESRFGHLPFSEQKFLKQVLATLNRKEKGAAFFAAYGGRAVGLIDIAIGEAWLSQGGCYATCLAWFVHPNIRKSLLGGKVATILYRQALDWAKGRGATELAIHATHGERLSVRGAKIIGNNIVIEIT